MIKDKIKTIKQLSRIINLLKKSGKKIGFTNGCFDILHVGHVKYLEKAKVICDILVVAINSNGSVKKIKGDRRPIIDEKDRMAIVAAIGAVDYVVKFSQETPLKIIKTIKPHILIKGGDWRKEDIVGADFVQSYKGKVKSLPYIKGHSTTFIIKSALKKNIHK